MKDSILGLWLFVAALMISNVSKTFKISDLKKRVEVIEKQLNIQPPAP